MKFENIDIGSKASREKKITVKMVEDFADLTGDKNPLHLDEDFASKTIFKGRIAHGMIGASLISAVLGNDLPGPGCIHLSHNLRFTAPVRIGDKITAEVQVLEKIPDKNQVKLKAICKNQEGKKVIDGEVLCRISVII